MKTQNNKLLFDAFAVVELNDQDLLDIDGGSTPAIAAATAGIAVGVGIAWLIR